MNSFYSNAELSKIGFRKFGVNVLISRKVSLYSPEKISIGNNVRIDDFCILSGEIILNNNVHISAYSALYGKHGIIMEDYTGLSPRCTIFSASDDFGGDFLISPMNPDKYTNLIGGQVLIKKFAQVGAGSIIMPNLIISQGVAIGAMSFVKKSLDEWAIYAGNPIKFIKHRKKGLLKYYDELTSEK
jgi:galactoside O-acetyltransferase